MSYADNIDSALKSLERAGETYDPAILRRRKESDKEAALAIRPWADKLRTGGFADQFLANIARIGHSVRIKPIIAWKNDSLRLDARGHCLELRPTAKGVVAIFSTGGIETESENVNLSQKSDKLAEKWLHQVASSTTA